MTEKGYPWDSYQEDKREYGAQDLANAFSAIVKNGVVHPETGFLVEPLSGNTVRVGAGTAWINGHMITILGYEDIEIPYEPYYPSQGPEYGRLILRCREETEYRDFQIAFKMPLSGGIPPAVEQNELSLALIRVNRGVPEIESHQIIQDNCAASVIHADVIDGTSTDIEGLIKGADGSISKAIPGTDYMPATGGAFKGEITYNNSPFQTLKRWKQGAWIVEQYQDGYTRALYSVNLGTASFNRVIPEKITSEVSYSCRTQVYTNDAYGFSCDVPVKFSDPIFRLWGVSNSSETQVYALPSLQTSYYRQNSQGNDQFVQSKWAVIAWDGVSTSWDIGGNIFSFTAHLEIEGYLR
nr:MAG TPA: hypothetical protein [Caudoviricetes sp.]